MMTPAWSLRRLHAITDAQIEDLSNVLIDCVEGRGVGQLHAPLVAQSRPSVLAPGGRRRGRGRTCTS